VTLQEESTSRRYSMRSSSQRLFPGFPDLEKVYRRKVKKASQASIEKNLEILQDIRGLFLDNLGEQTPKRIMASWKSNIYKALDILAIQGAPLDTSNTINITAHLSHLTRRHKGHKNTSIRHGHDDPRKQDTKLLFIMCPSILD
jgi:hypothetical protein